MFPLPILPRNRWGDVFVPFSNAGVLKTVTIVTEFRAGLAVTVRTQFKLVVGDGSVAI